MPQQPGPDAGPLNNVFLDQEAPLFQRKFPNHAVHAQKLVERWIGDSSDTVSKRIHRDISYKLRCLALEEVGKLPDGQALNAKSGGGLTGNLGKAMESVRRALRETVRAVSVPQSKRKPKRSAGLTGGSSDAVSDQAGDGERPDTAGDGGDR